MTRNPEATHPDPEVVHYSARDGIARLRIDRPERANAISYDVMLGIIRGVELAAEDPDVALVQLTGTGTVFSSGRDMKEGSSVERTPEFSRTLMKGMYRNLFEVLVECPKPTMAVVNGPAVAAGMELVLACDIRILVADGYLQLPEARRGVAANFGTIVLSQSVPRAVAAEWIFTGRRIPAEEAVRWGLVNGTAERDRLESAAAELAQSIAGNAPLSLRRMKESITKSWGLPLPVALRIGTLGPNPYLSEDREEGARAFFERREPNWSGR
jgi:enoyl-CoA hydratase/carnithine racemase